MLQKCHRNWNRVPTYNDKTMIVTVREGFIFRQTDQGNVVLVRVCVAKGAVVNNQRPGKGYQATGDRDGQERYLEGGGLNLN